MEEAEDFAPERIASSIWATFAGCALTLFESVGFASVRIITTDGQCVGPRLSACINLPFAHEIGLLRVLVYLGINSYHLFSITPLHW